MQTPHFFVARYAACAEQARLVSRAVESIRMWHPAARVTVVDDGSPAEFAYEPDGPLTDVVPNPYPRSGEVGTLRAAWAALPGPEDVAVAMHDSMVLTAPLTSSCLAGEDVAFLWHFERFPHMHLPRSLRLLSRLTLPDRDLAALMHAFATGFGRAWTGCFGVALAARKRALDRMQAGCGVFSDRFMSGVGCREDRQAAERLVGLVANTYGARKPGGVRSVCGNIFDHPDGWSGRHSGSSLAEILALAPPGPVFKTWSGR